MSNPVAPIEIMEIMQKVYTILSIHFSSSLRSAFFQMINILYRKGIQLKTKSFISEINHFSKNLEQSS